MTTTIPTTEPSIIQSGDTIKWNRNDLDNYPASLWTLSYVFINSTAKISLSSEVTASGDDFAIVIPAATSATWHPDAGIFSWSASVTDGSEVIIVDSGHLEILFDPRQATTQDTRTHVKKTLDLLESLIEGKAVNDDLEYSIEGRSLKRMTWEDINKTYNRYKALYQQELNAEKIANGENTGSRILARFNRP